MWAITTDGFVSLVEHDQNPDMIRARARRVEHLQATFDLGDNDIIDLGPGCPDYRYHADIPRLNVAQKMHEAVMDIHYVSHVKEAVAGKDDPTFYKAMMGCWRELYRLQAPTFEPDVGEPLYRQEYDDDWRYADTPLDGLTDMADRIGELANKLKAGAGDALIPPAIKPEPHAPLIVNTWAGDDDICLICGEDFATGDRFVTLPEDIEFDEPEGPAHADCAEEEAWVIAQ